LKAGGDSVKYNLVYLTNTIMRKKIIISLLTVLVLAGSWFGYRHFQKNGKQRNIMAVLPEDVVYILKTDELTDAWKEVSKTNIWRHFIRTEGFEYLQSVDSLLNKTLLNSKTTKYIFHNRPTLMAAYMTGKTSYDFVYAVDLKNTKYIKEILNEILNIGRKNRVKKLVYDNVPVYKLIDKKKPDNTVYLFSIDNLLLASFTYSLVQKIIDEKDIEHWIQQPVFNKINDKLDGGLVQFYFNYDRLPDFASIYFSDAGEDLENLARQLSLSGFDITQEDERIWMNGYTFTDSIPSYMNALLDIKPGKIKSHNVISSQAASVLSLGFKSFNLFYQSLLDTYAYDEKVKKIAYRNNLKKLERFLKIDLRKDLFDWIGQEVVLVKLRSFNKQRPADFVMLIEASDIDDARDGLQHLSEQIRKRSPFKFKSYMYKNFPVNYLHQKGFFKTVLGDLFKNLDKPFYTFIEDYVVFSNSEKVLKQFIDDYITGKTLSHDADYMDFRDELNAKANIYMYIHMPKLYDILRQSLTAAGKQALDVKKDLILSFSRVGFQLIAKDEMFKTLVVIDHDEKALQKEKSEIAERKIDKNVHADFFEDLQFKIYFPDSVSVADGIYRQYYKDGKTIKTEGKVQDNLPVGIWRTYYASGNLQSVVFYEKGDVNGDLFYYYDKKPSVKMVETKYDDNLLDGEYMEYWENGAQKAKLYYKNGKKHGDAFYYYPSGKIKSKGKYKNGKKKGKWIFYDEKGKITGKKRYSGLFF
jgi:hypothetical protein